MRLYCFGEFILDPNQRRLTKNDEDVELSTRGFDLLLLMLEHAESTVTKEELLEKVWGGHFVDEANIPVQISRLRTVLGDTSEDRLIRTVHGVGYCFSAPVEVIETGRAARIAQKRRSGEARLSVAVLPVTNETGDGELQFIADALTDSIGNAVSRLRGLRVVPRHSALRYADYGGRIAEIADDLDVTHVVTARLRRSEADLITRFEVIDCANDSQLFGEALRHDASDLVVFQESVTSRITDVVAGELELASSPTPFKSTTRNPESHRLYLKGMYLFEQRTVDQVRKAITCFESSIASDPSNVSAYVSLVESYRLLYGFDQMSFNEAYRITQGLIELIVQLDTTNDTVQVMLGGVKMYFHWDFVGAEASLNRALTLNPNNLEARYRLSDVLMARGKFADALKELNKLLIIDPASPATLKRVGKAFYRMSNFASARQYLNEALEINPRDFEALAVSAAIDIEIGAFSEALTKLKQSLTWEPNVDVESMKGYLFAKQGKADQAQKWIAQFESRERGRHPVKTARVFAVLGRTEDALRRLDKAFDEHEIDLICLISDPRWNALVQSPQFHQLVQRVGLKSES
jgi:DNA-binding winged helix-turn-helix (wHTH) protein/tetratricopeptide (TPR) repeat protein